MTGAFRLAATGLAAMLVAGAAGCFSWSHEGHAVAAASSAWSCPASRLQVLSVSGEDRGPPPADVAADPGRLAVWQKQADPEARNYVVTGCGQTGTVHCTYQSSGSEEWFACDSPSTDPSTQTRFWGFNWVGAKVIDVRPQGPAATAGLAVGDVIVEVDHQAVGEGVDSGKQIVDRLPVAGSSHSLRVQRGTQTLDLTLAPAPAGANGPGRSP